MTARCEEIRDAAMAIAALADGDPERARAEEHARECADCRAALDEGRRLLALVDALPPRDALAPAEVARAAATLLERFARARRNRMRALMVLMVALVGSAIAALLALGSDSEFAVSEGLRHCAALELACALLPLAATARAIATRKLEGGAPPLAAAAAAGALAGQGLMHLYCPHHGAAHLVAFHFGAVALAALLGAIASRLPSLRAT